MLSEKLLKALNDQITHEFASANLYLSMAAYCAAQGYEGFSSFFIMQAEEERFHAMKFFHFVNELGGQVVISGYPDPQQEFASVKDTFEKALAHEKFVTKLINDLLDLAESEKHRPTISFLQWFVDEQVEEEDSFNTIIDKFNIIGDTGPGVYMLDKELGQRTFSPEGSDQ
ncbi:MAG: ferritin [Firmicutes bacterium]|nr:ferritin [Bacillota bacterium]